MEEKCSEEPLHFYYFIGRLNPPHVGHLTALKTMVELAISQGSKALILLGSGPQKERTLNNPISFQTKARFIQFKLEEMGIPPDSYIIEEMGNPIGNVIEYVLNGIKEKYGETTLCPLQIDVTHVAGGKDEDTIKLSFIHEPVKKAVLKIAKNARVSIDTLGIKPEKSSALEENMSATEVRNHAYRCYGTSGETALDCFASKYGWFYKEMTPLILEDILYPVITQELTPDQLEAYISDKTLPKKKSEPTAKRAKAKGRKTKRKGKKTKRKKRRTKNKRI